MRVSAVNREMQSVAQKTFGKVSIVPNSGKFSPRVISLSDYLTSPISFTGAQRDKQQVIFIGAESDPWSKAGGVGTVMKDYRSFGNPANQIEITPYYGGEKNDQQETAPVKDEDGDYIMHTNHGDIKLDLVAEDTMQWGKISNDKIMLFRGKDDKDKLSYFVFVDDTAAMKKPYQNGYTYKTGAKAKNNGWNGDPYAKWSKAAVKLLPEAIKDKSKDTKFNFNPATIICSDAQTAYVQEYMAQESVKDVQNNPYEGIKPTYVGHNMGPGYCGETSMQNMFVNLGATPDQIDTIEHDPMYKQGILGDNYFKPFVEKVLDETGTASAVMIPIHYTQKDTAGGKGYAKAFTVVAEEYAKNLAENPQAAHNIHNHLKQLYSEGTFDGILNPLNDTSVDAHKPLPNALYNEDCEDTDGTIYPKFEIYPENPTYDEMRKVKNGNKLKLLERLSADDNTIVTGNPNRTAKINPEAPEGSTVPVIKPELLKMIKEGKGNEVPLFVSWGRIDTQKGHDITLKAFEKFAKSEEGKNAILILGAGLDNGEESKRVEKEIAKMLQDPELQGRIVHIDGWAPAYAMASAADAAIFSSRFEPCGLTDLEAMKYYCTPIVTNTQGFKQKNFDPRNPDEADKATSFKTTHEFNLAGKDVTPIIAAYVEGSEDAKSKVQEEFPIFKTVKNGKETYDDSVFKAFADKYSEFISQRKEDLIAKYPHAEALPPLWDDWDELSKDYSFKFGGFARDLKDSILTAEMSDAIGAYAAADNSTKETIFNNLKSLKTGWSSNNSLHPNNKSSQELYRTLHMMPDYSAPEKEDILAVDDDFVTSQVETRQNKDMKDRIAAYLAGGLTGLAGALFAKTGRGEYKSLEETLNKKIAELNKQLAIAAKQSRRNMVIAGVASAAVAAVATFAISRHFFQKQPSKEQDFLVVPDSKIKEDAHLDNPNSVKPMVISSPSLADFKNHLNVVR